MIFSSLSLDLFICCLFYDYTDIADFGEEAHLGSLTYTHQIEQWVSHFLIVKSLPFPPFHTVLFERKTTCNQHFFEWEHLHEKFGIFLYRIFVYSLSFIYLFNHLFLLLYTHRYLSPVQCYFVAQSLPSHPPPTLFSLHCFLTLKDLRQSKIT